MYGPPGTGKTYLAKACATESDGTFFSISSSDLISKWVGESEKLIKNLFELARERKPSIIFIDEIDSLCGNRSDGENEASRRVKTEFLVQMQGVGKDDRGLLVLGATNIPWGLDPAVRRRFERRVYIPLPSLEARIHLLKLVMNKNSHSITPEQFEYLGNKTEGYSGADLSVLSRDACYEPLRMAQTTSHFRPVTIEGLKKYTPCAPSDPAALKKTMMDLQGNKLHLGDITVEDFLKVLSKTKPSVSEEDIVQHVEWTHKFGLEG